MAAASGTVGAGTVTAAISARAASTLITGTPTSVAGRGSGLGSLDGAMYPGKPGIAAPTG